MNAPLGDAPQSLTGLHVVDADGAKVGTVQQVYRDDATNDPEWITVRTGLFGMKETFIPLAGARRTGDELHVPHAKETIKAAPRIDADGHLDPSEEADLYRHYGIARPGTSDSGGTSDPGGTSEPGGTSGAGGTSNPGGTSDPGGTSGSGGTSDPGGTSGAGGMSDPGGTSGAGGMSATGGLEGVAGDTSRSDTVVSSSPPPRMRGGAAGAARGPGESDTASGAGATGAAGRADAKTRATGDTAPPTPTGGERNKLTDRPMAGAGAGAGARSGSRDRGEADTVRGEEQAPVIVLSEEQMQIGTEEHESGRAHLRKRVVTEEVHRTVPVTHEEVRVIREPITDDERRTGRTAPRIGEGGEVEVVLYEEQTTISKKTVPVERVRLETERVTEQKEVSVEIRREEVEIDDGTDRRKGPGPDRRR